MKDTSTSQTIDKQLEETTGFKIAPVKIWKNRIKQTDILKGSDISVLEAYKLSEELSKEEGNS